MYTMVYIYAMVIGTNPHNIWAEKKGIKYTCFFKS